MPTEVKEEIDIICRGSIKSVLSYMSNMGIKSEPTGINYKKAEKMWNNLSDNTGSFPKVNDMEKKEVKGACGNQLATSLTVLII